MCGLAGFFDPARRVDAAAYEAIARDMSLPLSHRGPDDEGTWVDADAGIALGFRRLAILDLSPAGHQPMSSANGRMVMVFNGEIYNHHALRRELEGAGDGPWRSTSDSEALLAGFARWGVPATLERVDGMFAIALWDRQERRLWLARDRFGEKPLYYGMSGDVLLFGSELKALRAHPSWTGTLDRAALALFLAHAYVPAPHSAYTGIGKLPPGHYAWFSGDERSGPQPYWDLEECARRSAASPFAGDLTDATDELERLLAQAVASRLEADVPVGAFLSGGVDSSTVLAMMQQAGRGAVHSFSIGFPGTRYDESPHAEAVAKHLATRHLTLPVSEADCLAVLPSLQEIYDEPFADASQIPTVLLARLTRQHVTVGLSGDGGDELFGGYGRYGDSERAWDETSRRPFRRVIGRSTAMLLAGRNGRLARTLRKKAERWSPDSPAGLYRDRMSHWRRHDRLTPGLAPGPSRFDHAPPAGMPSLAQAFSVLDAATYLPDDLLVKVDRASMASSLEARAPLLDPKIAAFAWSLPPALAVAAGHKRVLREVLYRHVPKALVDRPKQGFEPPVGSWLREGLRSWADELLQPGSLARSGIVDPAVVGPRWQEHRSGRRNWTYPLWNVLMLEAWLANLRA